MGEETDPYGDLAPPKAVKKTPTQAKEQDTSAKRFNEAPTATSELSTKRKKTNAEELDIPQTIQKLKSYMMNAKKFAKASELFRKLLDEKFEQDNYAKLFLDALIEVVRTQTYVSGSKELNMIVQCILSKNLEKLNLSKERVVEDLQFAGIVHHELFTDDTYQFVRTAKLVMKKMQDLDYQMKELQLETDLCMPVLRTLFKKHQVEWAKTMVETVLMLATRKRLMFQETYRKEIDEWTKTIQDRRNAPKALRSIGSELRRNKISKSSALSSATGIKVGRTNHPLFNREIAQEELNEQQHET